MNLHRAPANGSSQIIQRPSFDRFPALLCPCGIPGVRISQPGQKLGPLFAFGHRQSALPIKRQSAGRSNSIAAWQIKRCLTSGSNCWPVGSSNRLPDWSMGGFRVRRSGSGFHRESTRTVYGWFRYAIDRSHRLVLCVSVCVTRRCRFPPWRGD